MRKNLSRGIAFLWVVFQIYIALAGGIPTMVQRPIHVGFALALVFLMSPFMNKKNNQLAFVVDLSLTLAVAACSIYAIFHQARLMERIAYVDNVLPLDLILGTIFVALLLIAGWRNMGPALPIISIVFLAYLFWGDGLPGILAHRGATLDQFVELQFMTTGGIFGSPIEVSVSTVYYFMLFGAFLSATPAGELFISMARFATQKSQGGEGKAAVIASALFGMISGSAAANVASTGVITYPMMAQAGFRPKFSASVIAVAGTGGQLFPPIMGAAAFIMADMVGISYFKIVLYAIIPSLLYIASLLFVVHFESQKCQTISLTIEKIALVSQIKKYFYLMIPLILLVFLIAIGRSLMYACLISILLLIVLCAFREQSRMSFWNIIDTLIKGSISSVTVAMPCAMAGIVVGVMVYTGLGLRLSSLIAELASGNLFIALLMAMVMVIILGMGMPSSAAYVMSAVLLAPAIQNMQVSPIVSHFFIFYFANLSMITPPVALASYTAAGIAKTGLWETGLEAFQLSFVIFLIPFIFVFSPALLGIGTPISVAWVSFTTLIGVLAMSIAVIGYYKQNLKAWMRAVMLAIALLLIIPESITDIIGLTAFATMIWYLTKRVKQISTLGKQ